MKKKLLLVASLSILTLICSCSKQIDGPSSSSEVPSSSGSSAQGDMPSSSSQEDIVSSGEDAPVSSGDTPISSEGAPISSEEPASEAESSSEETKVILTLTQNIAVAGSISGGGEYLSGSEAKLTAEVNDGYEFLGWYQGEELLSSEASFDYEVGGSNVSIEARFKAKSYSFTAKVSNSSYGAIYINAASSTDASSYLEKMSDTLDYASIVKVSAHSLSDVNFLGWFDADSTKVSSELEYTFTMPNKDYVLTAVWAGLRIHYNLNGGSNPDDAPLCFTPDGVTLLDPSRKGYTFKGWYIQGSEEKVDSVPFGQLEDFYVEARWEIINYSIAYDSLEMSLLYDAGDFVFASNPTTYTVEDSFALNLPSCYGYTCQSWLDEQGSAFTKIEKGTTGNLALHADWRTLSFSITYKNMNGASNDVKNPSRYTIKESYESGIAFQPATKTGYEFRGWYSDEALTAKVESLPRKTLEDITLYAKWEAKSYSFSLVTEDEAYGTVTGGKASANTDEELTVKATSLNGCAFNGWFDAEGNLVSEDNPYTFAMPAKDYTLKAEFFTAEETDALFAKKPVVASSGKTVTYGLYPRTKVSGEATIALLNNGKGELQDNGWYYYGGAYYAKNGGTWFSCEPINWKIVYPGNKGGFVVSWLILDYRVYNSTLNNNWENSDLRQWLNNDFYNSAFGLNNSYVQQWVYDNSVSSTHVLSNGDNPYACSNTTDYVTIMSYSEAFNDDYLTQYQRQVEGTEWAKSKGLYVYGENDCSNYWTRSPYNVDEHGASYVNFMGGDVLNYWVTNALGIRPFLYVLY